MTEPTVDGEALRGRQAEARRNDSAILEAALAVFSSDPTAPMSAVARAAGVGQATLYRRYPDKQTLLVEVCRHGLTSIADAAHTALTSPAPGRALREFLEWYVESGTLRMSALLGTFHPPRDLYALGHRANHDMQELMTRAAAAGAVRPDATGADLTLIATQLGTLTTADPERARELRRRYLTLIWQGLTLADAPGLPGPAPTADELESPWRDQDR